ncbi:MAG: TIR domain-containing protein [Opitutus sp.]|nr:TIR domain-containing protein [Opitutus sp.]
MSEPANKAVFLSYASQDTEAVRRICVALRAAGVEVWFDQSELVGGDAWDRKIRGQVNTCALFLPVISASTQARQEGYFRLEWHLAEQRSLLIAKGRPFIVPVSIDATSERGALVPDAFTAVQWTKLPGGETSAAFVSRVQTLLDGPDAVTPPAAMPSVVAAPARRSSRLGWVVGALGAVVVALVVFLVMRPAGKDAAPAPKPVAATKSPVVPPTAPAPVAPDKSIAVLPFANRSADKENEFFTDGVHEDILTNLCSVRALRVMSRTSVEQFRGTKKSIKEIGAELGVTYILEGSVQRVGNKVHVTGQHHRCAHRHPFVGQGLRQGPQRGPGHSS